MFKFIFLKKFHTIHQSGQKPAFLDNKCRFMGNYLFFIVRPDLIYCIIIQLQLKYLPSVKWIPRGTGDAGRNGINYVK